jgi:hypothetical protein
VLHIDESEMSRTRNESSVPKALPPILHVGDFDADDGFNNCCFRRSRWIDLLIMG